MLASFEAAGSGDTIPGVETISGGLEVGGITGMLDRVDAGGIVPIPSPTEQVQGVGKEQPCILHAVLIKMPLPLWFLQQEVLTALVCGLQLALYRQLRPQQPSQAQNAGPLR